MYKLTVDPELAPDEAQYLELTFERETGGHYGQMAALEIVRRPIRSPVNMDRSDRPD